MGGLEVGGGCGKVRGDRFCSKTNINSPSKLGWTPNPINERRSQLIYERIGCLPHADARREERGYANCRVCHLCDNFFEKSFGYDCTFWLFSNIIFLVFLLVR